ncbi:MAG: alpha-L-arabinofuranosidase, partial [Bacteroidales bacterium]|nr:alpha-L-arabinofuranosidase [Bacteroidales bacterium]
MKKSILIGLAGLAVLPTFAQVPTSQADSAWLFTYATTKNAGKNGLHFAWSTDGSTWHEIGPEWAPVKSDYGTWGPQKRMLDPRVAYNPTTRLWEAVWRVNEREDVLAYTNSTDMTLWKPQDYLPSAEAPKLAADVPVDSLTLDFSGRVLGQCHRVAWPLVDGLIRAHQLQLQKDAQNRERAVDDKNGRFRRLEPQNVSIQIVADAPKAISDKLIGIFFEDINYAADGGLYAELLQNRDFEYTDKDTRNWNARTSWEAKGLDFDIATADPIHSNNANYAVLKVASAAGAELRNLGWDGIALAKDAKYDLTLFGRVPEGKNGKLRIQLITADGTVAAEGSVSLPKGKAWRKVSCTLKSAITTTDESGEASLVITPLATGTYHLDMVSLFPQDTYKGRKNGMRRDLAEALEALHPQFVRFPGGCASHGNGLDNIYRWKNTIGPLESRKPDWNIWHYHQTVGLGYYEYFQLCEDLGARPLPVLAAGVPCQNSSVGGYGQQGGIPMDQMDEYVQDVLDLIEWANGDPATNKWAKMRADAGHPAPYNLKYLVLGNEEKISPEFCERFRYIYNKVMEKHPEIVIVGT